LLIFETAPFFCKHPVYTLGLKHKGHQPVAMSAAFLRINLRFSLGK